MSPYLVHSPHTRLFILIAVSYKRYLVKIASESWKEKHKANKGKERNGSHLCGLGWFELKLRFRLWFGDIPAKAREKKYQSNLGGD